MSRATSMSARRIHRPFATSVTPPQYSGCRKPSSTVRSRSLTVTFSCLVTQWSVVPKKCSGLQRMNRNSVPSTERPRIAFGEVTHTTSCGWVTMLWMSIADACER